MEAIIRKENIQNEITQGDYKKAENYLQNYKREFHEYDDTIAIFDAEIGNYYGDRKRVWNAIRDGLAFNYKNYELYVMLGNYYLSENMYQSYLCYENALFYCNDLQDKIEISRLLCQLNDQNGIYVHKTSIVLLVQDSLEYTKLCIKSIRMTTPEFARKIIVVDNGSMDGTIEWLKKQEDIVLVENKKEVKFSVRCNQGIRESLDESDIFFLSSDSVMSPNALFWLRMGLYARIENGVAGCKLDLEIDQKMAGMITNISDLFEFGGQTNIPMEYPYEYEISLNKFAFLVKYSIVDKIGMLDEKFLSDDYAIKDYGLKILAAGYKNILCKNSFIIHSDIRSDMKKSMEYTNILYADRKLLREKWEFDIIYYTSVRRDSIQLVDEPKEKVLHILDVGCGCGVSMGYLKNIYPNAEMFGIELNPKVAKIASAMGNVVCGNVEKGEFPWEKEYFDYIIMGDVLEHLMEPGNVLKKFRNHLKTGGHIIVSMPNVKHYSVLLPLLRYDVFPYSDAGILDRTHVKMYTGVEIQKLLVQNGYEIEKVTYTTIGQPEKEDEKIIDMLTSFMEIPSKNSFLAYQYIFRAVKRV